MPWCWPGLRPPTWCSRICSVRTNGHPPSRCPTNRAWTRSATPGSTFDVKFYLVAILFLVFDVELLFLYPWAVVAYSEVDERARRTCATSVFWDVLVFMATLVVAYVYAWRRGVFRWR